MKQKNMISELINQYFFEDGAIECYIAIVLLMSVFDAHIMSFYKILVYSALPFLFFQFKKKFSHKRIGKISLFKDHNDNRYISFILNISAILFSAYILTINSVNSGWLFYTVSCGLVIALILLLVSNVIRHLMPGLMAMVLICLAFFINALILLRPVFVFIIILAWSFFIAFMIIGKRKRYSIKPDQFTYEKTFRYCFNIVITGLLILLIFMIFKPSNFLNSLFLKYIRLYFTESLLIITGFMISLMFKNIRFGIYSSVYLVLLILLAQYSYIQTENQVTFIMGAMIFLNSLSRIILFYRKYPLMKIEEGMEVEIEK